MIAHRVSESSSAGASADASASASASESTDSSAGTAVRLRRRGVRRWAVPTLEVGSGMALAVVGLIAVGWSPALVGVLYLAAVTPALVRIDLTVHRLPNVLVLPGYAAAGVSVVLTWVADGGLPAAALIAGAAWFGFLLLLNLAGGMGMGDVKLGGVLGLVLGAISVDAALLGPMLAFLSGGIAAIVLLVVRRRRGTRMPFGPYLLLGFWAAVLLSSSPL
ncbi:prepilin peptidase [Naasia lichenicola]|uniref:Prepilin peptidase n=1 Tax=Naasia lichenicola TaxID=2565933 RepID=A0A4V3WSK4_9MICO|nr:A24 family peptidase [Naasia lichenicola]THG28427.1 prepilin peptidase [Naasia lichenicola]